MRGRQLHQNSRGRLQCVNEAASSNTGSTPRTSENCSRLSTDMLKTFSTSHDTGTLKAASSSRMMRGASKKSCDLEPARPCLPNFSWG
eukprot:3297435-Lingulodinium_polyedra.AAC.1